MRRTPLTTTLRRQPRHSSTVSDLKRTKMRDFTRFREIFTRDAAPDFRGWREANLSHSSPSQRMFMVPSDNFQRTPLRRV